jgi:hypothetical protein
VKVFISWSKDTSKNIGEVFRNWLPDVLQFVQPYFTPSDIEKGQRWSTEIANILAACEYGLFCITAENQHEPWLIFEAGAISKHTGSGRVCPFLFGLEPSQLTGPLLQFQAIPYSKEEVKKFILSLNKSAGEREIPEATVTRSFERCWPELDEKITAILSGPHKKKANSKRSVEDMAEETLNLVRALSKRDEVSIPESVNHWLVIFDIIIDYAEASIKITEGVEQSAQLDQLIQLRNFMKLAFNLIVPKVSSASTYKDRVRNANHVAKVLSETIKDLEAKLGDDIPF